MTDTKIIIIDDDPTGSQTVHSCLLLTRWDVETLKRGLQDEAPLFFILSNTRAMEAQHAAEVTRTICQNLKQALESLRQSGQMINPLVVSRSDSTLRGHYPIETDIIAEHLGPFDAHFMVPAFFEGGRITRNSTHYLLIDGEPVPVHETEFARDSVFGFSTAYLPKYVEEKTHGQIQADAVERFLLDDVRGDSRERLRSLQHNVCCVVDAEQQSDLNNFATQLLEVAAEGKRYLFRSAASLLTAFANLPPQPVPSEAMGQYVRNQQPGVILVGSHVSKTSQQLAHLRAHTDITAVHVDVKQLNVADPAQWTATASRISKDLLNQIEAAHQAGKSVVIYTTREELQFADQATRLAFGQRLSNFLMDIVSRLPTSIGFLISKGGITSNDVLSTGLNLAVSRVVGQILPGCSVIRCPEDHPRFPNLPVVIFPGNVGDEASITAAYRILMSNGAKIGGDTTRRIA
ncbi:four-carbon acid sugar kinase family protein [Kaarinaea lacus]